MRARRCGVRDHAVTFESIQRERLDQRRRTTGSDELGHRETTDRRRFERCERAFATDRYTVLYRCWREDGERVLVTASSPVLGQAMESGTGKIEPLVLPHAYSHLAPMAGVA